jgi:hypothetical protein
VPDTAAELMKTYAPRLAEFVSDERFGDWRCKLYGLADPDKGVRAELLDVTRELAGRSLPETGYGASFAIAHDAAYPIALVYWWQGVNELHQRSFIGEEIDGLEPVAWTPAGCVYELADRRVRAAGVDRGRDRQPGRARRRALSEPPLRRPRLATDEFGAPAGSFHRTRSRGVR